MLSSSVNNLTMFVTKRLSFLNNDRINRLLVNFASKPHPRGIIEFQCIPDDRIPELIVHKMSSFFGIEPMGEAMKVCESPEALEKGVEFVTASVKQGLSIIALNGENKIIGASVNGILLPGALEEHLTAYATSPPTNPLDTILSILDSTHNALNLFERYSVDKIFDIQTVSVDREYRGMNIAGQMMAIDRRTARDAGFKVCMASATSQYMASVLRRSGFDLIKEVRFDSMLDGQGKRVAPVKAPHESLKILIMQI